VALLLTWCLPLLSSVYFGIARRALNLAILSVQTRGSLRNGIVRHADKPAVQRQIGQAEIKLEAASALVDIAVQVVEASSVSRRHELERLYRDVRTVRCIRRTDAVLEGIGAAAMNRT
jgi:alkylation response protein AidB-like acyl-CoA dehydrogenase